MTFDEKQRSYEDGETHSEAATLAREEEMTSNHQVEVEVEEEWPGRKELAMVHQLKGNQENVACVERKDILEKLVRISDATIS